MADPDPVCALCSKPIRPGTDTSRAGETVVHVRCLAQETGLRALDLRDQATGAVARAERAVAEGQRLASPRQPMPGVTVGLLEAIGRAPGTIQVGGRTYQVADPALLRDLRIGMRISVVWDSVGGQRQASKITET